MEAINQGTAIIRGNTVSQFFQVLKLCLGKKKSQEIAVLCFALPATGNFYYYHLTSSSHVVLQEQVLYQ